MRSFDSTIRGAVAAVLLVAAIGGGGLLAQPAAPAAPAAPKATPAEEKLADNWKLFLHFVLMAEPDKASSYGEAILLAKPDPRKLYYLAIDTDDYGSTLARGRRTKKLQPTIDKINALIDSGARSVRTDPKEIARWIKALGGPPRGYAMAREWLIACGEYAVPQMVWALGDVKTSPTLRERIVTVIPKLGRSAVRPLVEALATKDVAAREVVCRALGKIGYRHASAALKELAETKGLLPRTRDAALGALAACAGTGALKKSVADLYYEQALNYYERRESVLPDSRYQTANVWYWHDSLGVTYKLAPRSIFTEVYAMRAAAKALEHNPKLEDAVSLWIAANYRKEANLPPGAKDPTLPAGDPGAEFYGRAAGTKYLQAVLARALKDGDARVAVRAIEALALAAGAENLVKPTAKGTQPLVDAMDSTSRQVRYLAAEALAKALPNKPFTGSGQVISVLVEALRQTGKPSAVVVDPDLTHRNTVKDLVRGFGADVFDAASLGKALQDARAAGGVDLILLSSELKGPDVAGVVGMIRRDASLRRVPVVVVTRLARLAAVQEIERTDPMLVALPEPKLDAPGMLAAFASFAQKAAGAGPLDPKKAVEWAVRAAKCFLLLGETNNPVYELTGATKSLIAALADKRPQVQVAAAEALAVMADTGAQQALAGLADDAGAAEPIRLAAYAAATRSVRLFGNKLTGTQASAVVDVVSGTGSVKIRNAAAQLLGALNLPSEKIKELIR